MMYKKNYRAFVEKISIAMGKYGEVTKEVGKYDNSITYYLNATPYGKMRVFIETFKIKQNKQYMCITLSEPSKIPNSLTQKSRLSDGFGKRNGKYMNWCSNFDYMESWFNNLIECIFETEE